MRRTATLWEVFVSRFEEAFEQYQRHQLTAEEAAALDFLQKDTEADAATEG